MTLMLFSSRVQSKAGVQSKAEVHCALKLSKISSAG